MFPTKSLQYHPALKQMRGFGGRKQKSNQMQVQLLIKHHQKCVAVLEMIERCKRYQMDAASYFTNEMMRSYYKKRFDSLKAVEKRLTNYYNNLISKHV